MTLEIEDKAELTVILGKYLMLTEQLQKTNVELERIIEEASE